MCLLFCILCIFLKHWLIIHNIFQMFFGNLQEYIIFNSIIRHLKCNTYLADFAHHKPAKQKSILICMYNFHLYTQPSLNIKKINKTTLVFSLAEVSGRWLCDQISYYWFEDRYKDILHISVCTHNISDAHFLFCLVFRWCNHNLQTECKQMTVKEWKLNKMVK